MPKRRLSPGGILILAAAIGLAAMGPALARDDDDDAPKDAPKAATLKLEGEALRLGGIETAALKAAPPTGGIEAFGMIVDPAPLAELANNIAATEAQWQAAKAKLAVSSAALSRARKLYRAEAPVLMPQLQAAEAAALTDQAALASLMAQKRSLAATARADWGEVLGAEILAGGAGVKRLTARKEMLLLVTMPPERTLTGTPGGFALVPGKADASLRFVSAATRADPRLQGMRYFFTAPNDGGLLPQMRVRVMLGEAGIAGGQIVPEAAVVRWQGAGWVYLREGGKDGGKGFARHKVAMDRLLADGGGYLVAGLPEDGEIVVRGAALLLSEELKAQTQNGDSD